MKKLLFIIALIASFNSAVCQIIDPIEWSAAIEMKNNDEGEIILDAYIDKGWHLYGLDLPTGGPIATTINFTLPEGIALKGNIEPSFEPIRKRDKVFDLDLSWWEKDVTFTQRFVIAQDVAISAPIIVKVRFQGCNDNSCIAPKTLSFDLEIPRREAKKTNETMPAPTVTERAVHSIPSAALNREKTGDDGHIKIDNVVTDISVDNTNSADVAMSLKTGQISGEDVTDWWKPVKFDNEDIGRSISDVPWWHIFLWGFGGGLLALLTPCVWPLIPMTVSFFLKKSSSKGKAIGDALIYGVSIIVLYLGLGLAITLLFGASKLNDLATNAIFNLLFFILLIVFAISFFGAFNISLPSKWSNSVDSKAEKTTGLISIFFMAFTLALVSFSCTGPIIGTLLVEAASMGNITGPAIGMGAFALALAIPFTLFAIFPSWLKEMPKSGGWMNTVKVVLGFLELALSLKFLSVADLAYGWGLLDREVFVSLWIVIFVLLGLYLLGKLRFAHDEPKEHVSIVSFFLALISLSFAIYLVPGLWGAPLKSVSAFVPPLYTQDFNLYSGGRFEEFDDYDLGMQYAAKNNMPVLIDFSGYGCVNCRKMEGAVFDTQEVETIIKDRFVLIKLMVDDKETLAKELTVKENGKQVTLETVGDKWSYLQRMKFGANSQPFYVILDNQGEPLTKPYYYDENVTKFVEWMNGALERYE